MSSKNRKHKLGKKKISMQWGLSYNAISEKKAQANNTLAAWIVDLHQTPSRAQCGRQSLNSRHSRAGTPMYRTSQTQFAKPLSDNNKGPMGNTETLQNKTSRLSIKHMSSSHSVPECAMHNAVLNISQTKDKPKCTSTGDSKKVKKPDGVIVTTKTKIEHDKKNWDDWIEPDLNLREMLDKLEQEETSINLDNDLIANVAGSSDSMKFTALSEALMPKQPCTFIVMGSNPGEPKRNFKDDHLQPLLSKIVAQNKYNNTKSVSSEGKLHQIGIGGILKWHIFDTTKNYMEQIIKDGGDSCMTLEDTEAADNVVPYYEQYAQYKKKCIKKVNFHTEVDVISFAGGEGGNVIGRKFEPLKNEKMQQARNSELRKGYSVFRINRVEAWPKHLKLAK